jgi:predicted metalloenzyme YecM
MTELLIESCWRMIEFLMPTDTKIFRKRWPSRLVATAAEDRMNF